MSGKKIRTECFFQFLQYFRDSSYPCNNVLRKDRIKHFKNFQNFFFFETCSEYSDLSSKSEILEQIVFAQYGLFHMKIAAAYEMIQL